MTLAEIRIRKANLYDLDNIKSLADDNKDALGFILRPALQTGIERGWILVAENAEQEVIGFVHYRHRQDFQTTLYEVCVTQAWRGNGVGRSLIDSLSDDAAALGKKLLRLKSPVDLAANEFYKRLGFKVVRIETGKQRQLNVWEISTSANKT